MLQGHLQGVPCVLSMATRSGLSALMPLRHKQLPATCKNYYSHQQQNLAMHLSVLQTSYTMHARFLTLLGRRNCRYSCRKSQTRCFLKTLDFMDRSPLTPSPTTPAGFPGLSRFVRMVSGAAGFFGNASTLETDTCTQLHTYCEQAAHAAGTSCRMGAVQPVVCLHEAVHAVAARSCAHVVELLFDRMCICLPLLIQCLQEAGDG